MVLSIKLIFAIIKIMESESLKLAKTFLGKDVEVIMDRPLGSKHPKHGFVYEANYGYIEGVKAPDGEDLDAYYLGTNEPLNKANGVVKAIIHRLDDDDDKLIAMPKNVEMSEEKNERLVAFQEKWSDHQILK